MILTGPLDEILLAVITALIGCILLAAALEGYLYFYGKPSVFSRILIFVSGFLLLYPGWFADIVGFVLLVVFMILTRVGFLRILSPATVAKSQH
jgi:TRAP-type uncharacterized transport system fused permease subunit